MEGTPTMEAIRSSKFDKVVSEVQKARDAGLPVPEELLLEAVEVRTAKVAKREKDFTFSTLGQFQCLAGVSDSPHSVYVDLGQDERFDVRGFFAVVEEMRVPPAKKGGPIAEDDVAVDYIPGKIVVAGVVPALMTPYVVYSITYSVGDNGYETAVGVEREAQYVYASELRRWYPAVTPLILLRMVSDGFVAISQRHQRLAEQANRIALAMGHQDANLMRLLEQAPPKSI